MDNYTYTYACRSIFNTITTSGHSSLEKYTSHFIERIVCERWVGDWIKTATYWPPSSSGHSRRLFRSPGLLNRGPGGPASLLRAGSHSSIWNTDFKLWTPNAWHPVSPRLYHCFTSTQFNPSIVKVIPWSLRPDAQVHFSFDSLARSAVNMQHSVYIFRVWNYFYGCNIFFESSLSRTYV